MCSLTVPPSSLASTSFFMSRSVGREEGAKGLQLFVCCLLYRIYWAFTPASASLHLGLVVSWPFMPLGLLQQLHCSSAFSPASWWATSGCRRWSVPGPMLWHPSTQIPPHCGLVVRLLPIGYGVSCIGRDSLWLEAISQLGISCEMKHSKRRIDNPVTREVSRKTEEFMFF